MWGQRQLVLIYNAINAWTNQNENDFWRIILANSERRRARLATYYTEEYKVEQQESIITPWQYKFGSALEFGIDGRPRPDRPFVFTIFSNFIGERLCRVPFSVFSLTESNATHAELKVKGQALTLLNENSRLVEQSHLESKIRQNLYNSKLAIYSVATHCLANCIELDEVLKAYELSSALATFCLNLSKTLFDSLIEPEEFSIWQDRTKSLKELADPGFAFLTIAKRAPKYHNSLSVEDWLTDALINAGLPDLETIHNLAYTQMQELEYEILDGRYSNKLRLLLSIGRYNFVQRGIWGQNTLSMENLLQTTMQLPPVVLGDQFVVPVTSKSIQFRPDEMDQWIDEIINIEASLDRFIQACRF
ncbi:MAG TPA: hypothetical protein IGS40_15525 [Trichormus sp. M33_DOE_039]|nr:hypothetical protein [Trichormus sp. M33_DOE_039]